MAYSGEAGVGFLEIRFFLDKANINLLQLKPLSEVVDFGRKSFCIPLEDVES